MEAKFNLVDEGWIPVLREGQVKGKKVGIREALLEAPTILRIETPSPLEEAALHRLLLAVLHRALKGPRRPEDVLDWWRAGRFPEEPIEDYLNHFRDRFFLFHPEAPFLQVGDLPKSNPKPWSKLLPELASGNNPTLFDHTTEENVPKATYAQAARALLVQQTFALGGVIGNIGPTKFYGRDAPLARDALFLPAGRNLLETLLLNLVPYTPEGDAPIWEVDPPLRFKDIADRKVKWPLSGRTRVYTWPSRGVRLLDEGDGVRFMGYGPGVKPSEAVYRDPMVAQRLDAKGNVVFLRFSEEKSFWRDFSAMLPRQGGKVAATVDHAQDLQNKLQDEEEGWEGQVALRVLGQVSDQAKVLDVRREVYPLPPGLLSPRAEERLEKALKAAEELGQSLRRLALEVARGVMGERDHQELENFARSLPLERLYWHALDGAFPRFLAQVEKKGSLDLWREELKGAARGAWEATRLFLGTKARHLKALAEGERLLGYLLGRLEEVVG